MNKHQFLNIISNGLLDFPEKERKDIIYDYEEHFDVGLAQGKSEEDIILELGDPHTIVNQYRKENNLIYDNTPIINNSINNGSDNGNSKVFAIILIILLLLFSPGIFGIVIGILGAMIGLIGGTFAIGVAGLAITLGTTVGSVFGLISIPSGWSAVPGTASLLIGIGTLALGILSTIGSFYLIRAFILLIIKFVKWIISVFR
ncbi:DUF1700 domain-containing protein [Clostridium manihotivorum]|uniref:DUF1700 domain-containing protein n=1 Tax=Clostridium manihotivorum TaxID=2320868 RepID=A0A410E0I8_9CLOT|nr:DUF1700 domain-containing protein [Clostridium manihotivorum]QAA34821.1 hypothetical protein C1I91_26060 [Clostridium manihotivorum]